MVAAGAPATWHWLERRGQGFDEARLRAAFQKLARGLEALHAASKVHRDIKPSNVLVTAEGRVVILDFGVVMDVDRGERAGTVVGTAHFMALFDAAAHRRLGELLGGDEGAALARKATSWMEAQGIVNPTRITELLAPGFSHQL